VSSVLSASAIAASSVGRAASLTNSGKTVVGAGTSVYKDSLVLTPPCLKYLNIEAIFDSSYLYSYTDSSTGTATPLSSHPITPHMAITIII
jgi:hypothetical protein